MTVSFYLYYTPIYTTGQKFRVTTILLKETATFIQQELFELIECDS